MTEKNRKAKRFIAKNWAVIIVGGIFLVQTELQVVR